MDRRSASSASDRRAVTCQLTKRLAGVTAYVANVGSKAVGPRISP